MKSGNKVWLRWLMLGLISPVEWLGLTRLQLEINPSLRSLTVQIPFLLMASVTWVEQLSIM